MRTATFSEIKPGDSFRFTEKMNGHTRFVILCLSALPISLANRTAGRREFRCFDIRVGMTTWNSNDDAPVIIF